MADVSQDNLLARLAGRVTSDLDPNPWASVSTTHPDHDLGTQETEDDPKLHELLNRIKNLTGSHGAQAFPAGPALPPVPPAAREEPARRANARDTVEGFLPLEPSSLKDACLTEGEVEALCLKFLLSCGNACGRSVADQAKLPFKIVEDLLREMKNEQLVVYRGTAPMNDYQYQLTDMGRERARRYALHCTYFGSAPVSLQHYIESVRAQTMTRQNPTVDDLKHAFDDLLLSPRMLNRLGPAINSGRGLFLYGAPGNGKSSIAERITRAFGQLIWIPRSIGVDGEIMRLFDPSNHEEVPLEPSESLIDTMHIDKRWVRIRRPTIIVGGELTMGALEVTLNTSTGISEAPLQLKSNCGTLVIDDFGRQRMSTDELLNRWIVPLEKRHDFLNLPNGKKIEVPFDQLIVFSTNLQPKDLVDDAFLRRIPYKIDVVDPTEEEFRELFRIMCPKLGFEYLDGPIDRLIEIHYRGGERPFRCCHPRDLLLQIRNFCLYQNRPLELSDEYFDFAVENYFAVM